MQVVIDTNIIVSSLLTKDTNASFFMDKVYAECYDVICTKEILNEYKKVLHYGKFPFVEDDIDYILNWFSEHAIFVDVDVEEKVPYMEQRDKTDKVFYWAAKRTNSLLVTGNIKHYPVEEMRTMLWEIV
jgi:putative PIN family toxin of toxin-antitoxin system